MIEVEVLLLEEIVLFVKSKLQCLFILIRRLQLSSLSTKPREDVILLLAREEQVLLFFWFLDQVVQLIIIIRSTGITLLIRGRILISTEMEDRGRVRVTSLILPILLQTFELVDTRVKNTLISWIIKGSCWVRFRRYLLEHLSLCHCISPTDLIELKQETVVFDLELEVIDAGEGLGPRGELSLSGELTLVEFFNDSNTILDQEIFGYDFLEQELMIENTVKVVLVLCVGQQQLERLG